MNFFIFALALILLAALALAVELLGTNKSAETRGYAELWAAVCNRRDYLPVDRLFGESDFELLADRPDLTKQLRSRRRRTARLVLRELRGDFLDAWTLCRILSPVSPDSGLAVRLAGHWLAFHTIYAGVMLGMTFAMGPTAAAGPSELVRAVRALQSGAGELIQTHQKLGLAATAA